MHSVFFSLKRAFHKTAAFGRWLLTDVALTPSRFDMLYVLHENKCAMRQSDLRRSLGVTAATVSRMLHSLEELGLISRNQEPCGDRRQRSVSMTREGIRRVRRAMRTLLGLGVVHFAVETMLAPRLTRFADRLSAVESCEIALVRIREWLCDTAWVAYPWHPDD